MAEVRPLGRRVGRRGLLRWGVASALLAGAAGVPRLPVASAAGQPGADEALRRLIEGNQRASASRFIRPNQTDERRAEIAKEQSPFAVVLGCADSRVPPELVFDQGYGDLFVIRVAGNIASEVVLGSIEYAVEAFHVPLVVVLGHERCGAVSAALDVLSKGTEAPGHISALIEAVKLPVQQARLRLMLDALKPGAKPNPDLDVVDLAVRANTLHVVDAIQHSEPLLKEEGEAGRLKVVGMRYDLDTALVEVLS